ncbi:hypothetical protein KI387_009338, partial [Taxus chinensis]
CKIMWAVVVTVVVAFVVAYVWGRSKRCKNTPPGSMGLPFVGETLEFLATDTSYNISPFIKKRMLRYGSLFKTHLLGRPTVVSADSDFNQFVFQQEDRLFESWFPTSFRNALGEQNISTLHGQMHKYLRRMILSKFGFDNIKGTLLIQAEDHIMSNISTWNGQVVNIRQECGRILFEITAKILVSYKPIKGSGCLRDNFSAFSDGLLSFPLNIPGTTYYKCLKGKFKALATLDKMLRQRSENPDTRNEDFLDLLVDELKMEETPVTRSIALDLIFSLLFAGYETTTIACTAAIKFITEHPEALQRLTEEHDAILGSRREKNSQITWKEYTSMEYTSKVIIEALRLANIVAVIFRKTLKDVDFKGYNIPADWIVIVCPPALHLNPTIYSDPLSFNPDRWECRQFSSKNFIPFGGGMRLCPGMELAKLELAMFLHCLVTNY